VVRWHALSLIVALGCSGSDPGVKPGPGPDAVAVAEARPAPPPAPPAAKFQPYTSPDGTFRVNFPGVPRARSLPPVPALAKSGMEIYTVEWGQRVYNVLCTHYTGQRDPAKELPTLVDGNVRAGIEGKLVESSDVTLKGLPGKDVTISLDDDKDRRARFFVGAKEIYQVVCDLPKTEADRKNAAAFVESFQLLKD